jgi:hypothetical protein
VNCGEDVENTDDRIGVIHENGKYACWPKVKSNDPRWVFVAEVDNNFVELDDEDLYVV